MYIIVWNFEQFVQHSQAQKFASEKGFISSKGGIRVLIQLISTVYPCPNVNRYVMEVNEIIRLCKSGLGDMFISIIFAAPKQRK
jgi:hypothetical protein